MDTAAMDANDRLSALQDRLLHRVVSFLDVSDAPRTGLLSRRWRELWRDAGPVNLNTRSYRDDTLYDGERVGRRLFLEAEAVVGAAGRRPVRRLRVLVATTFEVMSSLLGLPRH
ncbi:hypothetical protein ACP4OV_020439 [Aristida adscensionis]